MKKKIKQQYMNLYLFGESGTTIETDENGNVTVKVEDLMKKYYEKTSKEKES